MADHNSIIPNSLIEAYLQSDYCVEGENPFTLKVGLRSPELIDLFHRYGFETAAFLTAWNPYSRKADESRNNQAQKLLAGEIGFKKWKTLPSFGRDAKGEWPIEPGFLIFGMTLEDARALALKYEQNGFIWCEADAVPQLVLMR